MSSYYTADKLPPEERTNRIGVPITRGGIISVGTVVTDSNGAPEFFKLLHVGNGGNLLVQGKDGSVIPFLGLLNGDWIPVVGDLVLASATIGGTPYTTTCTNITWHGGI